MENISSTRMSSKGQVVIPEELRKTYGWKPGTSFIVLGRGNAIVLQPLSLPDMTQFDDLIAKSRSIARKVGMTQSDIRTAIKNVRKRKHVTA